jgi:hypothetical protein
MAVSGIAARRASLLWASYYPLGHPMPYAPGGRWLEEKSKKVERRRVASISDA